MAKKGRLINGILLLDKDQGASSNAVMQKVKRLFNASKAGHTGALDPLATGMLPVCLGEATKFAQFLLDTDKRYLVTATLGIRTDTSDADGQIVSTRAIDIDAIKLSNNLDLFRGDIMQIPSMFSALKHEGQPLYKYARMGINIEREARPITVYELNLLEFKSDKITLEIHCSKGTYIRTIIDDLGEALGCGAHVTELRRLSVSNLPMTMYKMDELQDLSIDDLDKLLLPIDAGINHLEYINLTKEQSIGILMGQRLKVSFKNADMIRIFDHNSNFLGVGIIKENILSPKRLVNL